MADESKIGTPWSDEDLDATVADYFVMLDAELEKRQFYKSRHNAALRARIGRTRGAIEFKHQNISAVLEELGLPWIAGYVPMSNYQDAIVDAIGRYLARQPAILRHVPPPRRPAPDPFVPPPLLHPADPLPEPLQRLVRKFDPTERDRRNHELGTAGEEFVVELERRRLTDLNRADLAKKIRWVAKQEGDGAGYDILSYRPQDGKERLIEVKTTNGSARTPFFLTRNEHALRSPLRQLSPPLQDVANLIPERWRASFGAR